MTLLEFMKCHIRITSGNNILRERVVNVNLTLKPGKKQKPITFTMRNLECSPDVLLTMSQLLY